jgi:hypothetical protein
MGNTIQGSNPCLSAMDLIAAGLDLSRDAKEGLLVFDSMMILFIWMKLFLGGK